MKIKNHEETLEFAITNLGKQDIFLRHDWLSHHNPDIDWTNREINFIQCPGTSYQELIIQEPEDEINQISDFKDYNLKEDKLLAIHIDMPEYI